MNAKKIYIVTAGCYSDYSIEAVFTTQDKANDYIQQHGTDYNIEEYELDEEVTKQVQVWRVEFKFNIDTKELSECVTCYKAEEYRDTCRVIRYLHSENLFLIYVDADSMDRAVKIASERFAAIKSNDYIWSRLTTPYATDRCCIPQFERFNTKTNEFTK